MTIKDKILVIEDEQNISNFISAILTANGYDVLVARKAAPGKRANGKHFAEFASEKSRIRRAYCILTKF